MHGPYTAHFEFDRSGESNLELSETELREGSALATRYYQDASPGLVEGALRSAVFTAAILLTPGHEVSVVIHGFIAGEPAECRFATARRDARGRFVSDIGSQWARERVFVGA